VPEAGCSDFATKRSPRRPWRAALEVDRAVKWRTAFRAYRSHVLWVDVGRDLLALEGVLKPLGGALVKARSGEDALLYCCGRRSRDLLDVQMPRLTACRPRSDQAAEATRHIPSLRHGAQPRTAYVFKGTSRGGGLLLKPIDPEIPAREVRVFSRLFVRAS